MKAEPYQSYLVRFWQEAQGGEPSVGWHGELESIQTGEKWPINSLKAMVQCLQTQLGEQAPNS